MVAQNRTSGWPIRQLAGSLLLILVATAVSEAAPPYQTLQRVPTAPHSGANCASKPMPLPVQGYAYGYFGASRNTHSQRSFGVARLHTQWSRW